MAGQCFLFTVEDVVWAETSCDAIPEGDDETLVYMKYMRSKADLCLNFKWIDGKLPLWITWDDDCLMSE
jgi:hypothetical protein